MVICNTLTLFILKKYIYPILPFLLCYLPIEQDNCELYTSNKIPSKFPPCTYAPNLWLKADAGTRLIGDRVSNWGDQSGNVNNATQSNNNNRPLYINNAINFNPTLAFDGDNDFLQGNGGGSNTLLFLVAKSDIPISNGSSGQTIITTNIQNPSSDVYFFTLGSITAAFPNEVITHGFGNSTEYRRVETGNTIFSTSSFQAGTRNITVTLNDGIVDSAPYLKEIYVDENLAMCCHANAPLISK